MIGKILSLLFGLFTGRQAQDGGVSSAAGAFNSVAFYGALIGFATWLIGPGRDFEITLRGWEIWAVVAVSAIVGAVFLDLEPPNKSGGA